MIVLILLFDLLSLFLESTALGSCSSFFGEKKNKEKKRRRKIGLLPSS